MIHFVYCLCHSRTQQKFLCGSVSVQIQQGISLLLRSLRQIEYDSHIRHNIPSLCCCISIRFLCRQICRHLPVPDRLAGQKRKFHLGGSAALTQYPITVFCSKHVCGEILRLRRQLPVCDPVFSGLSRSIIFPDRVDPDVQISILIIRSCKIVQSNTILLLQISHLLSITVRRIVISHILVNRGTSLCRTSRHYISRNHTIQSGGVPGGRINTVAGDLISSSNIRKRSGGYLYIHPFFRQFCHGSPIFIPGSVFRIDHSGLIFSVQRTGRMPAFTVDVSQ